MPKGYVAVIPSAPSVIPSAARDLDRGGMTWFGLRLGHRDDPNTLERELGGFERIWRIAPRAVMHALATSPDDLLFWGCRSGRYEQRPEGLLQRKKMSLPFIGLVQGKTLPDFIRKNSPNPNEFAQFAFNVL